MKKINKNVISFWIYLITIVICLVLIKKIIDYKAEAREVLLPEVSALLIKK